MGLEHDRHPFTRLKMRLEPVRKREIKILSSDTNRENTMLANYLDNKWREMQQLRAELESGETLHVELGRVIFSETVQQW